MRIPARVTVASLITLTLIAAMTACTRAPSSDSAYSPPSCSQLLTAAVAYERSGSGDVDSTLQALSDNCSDEYEIAVGYLAHSTDSEFSIDSCDELLGYGVREESVALLEQDGRCSFGGSESGVDPQWPEGGLGWDAAREHAGTVQRVCGPLMSVGRPLTAHSVNIGRDYPSSDRFTFIFWGMSLEPIEPGATVCGSWRDLSLRWRRASEDVGPDGLEIALTGSSQLIPWKNHDGRSGRRSATPTDGAKRPTSRIRRRGKCNHLR